MRILPTPLAREITVLLALKAVALAILWALFFGPQHRPDVTSSDIEGRLVGDTAPGPRPPPRIPHD
jgi:hypothetical protein